MISVPLGTVSSLPSMVSVHGVLRGVGLIRAPRRVQLATLGQRPGPAHPRCRPTRRWPPSRTGARPRAGGHRPSRTCSSYSSRKYLIEESIGETAPSASAQNDLNSMFWPTSCRSGRCPPSRPGPRSMPPQDPGHPPRALAARRALAAGLVGVELREPERGLDDAVASRPARSSPSSPAATRPPATESKSIGVSRWSAVRNGVDDPPGVHALSAPAVRRSRRRGPRSARRAGGAHGRLVVPGPLDLPGDARRSPVPVDFSVPIDGVPLGAPLA